MLEFHKNKSHNEIDALLFMTWCYKDGHKHRTLSLQSLVCQQEVDNHSLTGTYTCICFSL